MTLSRRRSWVIAFAVMGAMSLSYVDRQALSVLAPTVTKALAISDAQYGLIGSAFAIAYLAGAPVAGILVDRFGARRSLPAAIVFWSVVAALHAIAPGFSALFALRLALGLAESPSFPAGVQVVHRALPAEDHPRGMALLFVGMSVGGMLAPPLAIGLATRWGYRAAFVGTACVAALWVPLWRVLTGGEPEREVLDGGDPAAKRPGILAAASHPAMVRGLVGLLSVVPMSAFMLAWEAKYYVRQFGVTQGALAGYLMASAVLYDAGALAFGDLVARAARRRSPSAPPRALFAAGVFLAATGMVLLAFAATPLAAWGGMVLGAIGRGAVITLVNSDTVARMPVGSLSAAGGVIASVQSLGAIIVNPLIGRWVGPHGYQGIVLALAAWTVPSAIAWIVIPAVARGSDEVRAG